MALTSRAQFGATGGSLPKKKRRKRKKSAVPDETAGAKVLGASTSSSRTKAPLSEGLKLLSSLDENRGYRFFSWLIHPVSVDDFMKKHFEKAHLHVARSDAASADGSDDDDDDEQSQGHHYSGWYASDDIKAALSDAKNDVQYTRDIDITKYVNGVRKTFNPSGRADMERVWAKIRSGCSLRVLRPQEYSDRVCSMLALMDEFFGCVSGANAYLTPGSSQGFAPHFDDVDVFVLQLEGRKRWRLYPPRSPADVLPLASSPNLDQDEIGEPFLDVVLRPGDLLYAPRGTIHQAVSLPGTPSLHLTLSTGQRNTWADYLGLLLPRAVEFAASEDSAFRESLPRGYLSNMGVAHVDKKKCEARQAQFRDRVIALMERLAAKKYLPLHAAADRMALRFMHGRVPPLVPARVRQATHRPGAPRINQTMSIALVAPGCARLVMEDDAAMLYYCTGNSRVYMAKEEQALPFADHCAPALEKLIDSYPRYVRVGSLEGLESEEQVIVANFLFEAGIVAVKAG